MTDGKEMKTNWKLLIVCIAVGIVVDAVVLRQQDLEKPGAADNTFMGLTFGASIDDVTKQRPDLACNSDTTCVLQDVDMGQFKTTLNLTFTKDGRLSGVSFI